jgi:hypothetical protein
MERALNYVMLPMDTLGRIRGFSFNPSREFAASKEDSLSDAFKYYVPLLTILAAILAIMVPAVILMLGSPEISKFAPLLGAGAFAGIIVAGIIAALYVAVWLHIWVYLFGGRKGLKQTVKAVTYGATPLLLLGWVPGPNIIIAPIWSLLLVVNGTMELHELSSGRAILAVILAILIPLIVVGAIAIAFVQIML